MCDEEGMTRLTPREIRHNSRAIARQLNGLSITDARRVLTYAGAIVEAETPVLIDQVELDTGADLIPNCLDTLGQGAVGEHGVKARQDAQRGVALLAGDDNDAGVTSVNQDGLGAELGVSAFGAFDHGNLQGQAPAGMPSGQARIGGDYE